MDELGKIVRPQSPTRSCGISPEDKSHIGLILSETKVSDRSGEKILGLRTNEIVCALSSKTIYLSNTGQVISNIDLPYYWCNFCTFKSEDKHMLIKHLMEHRFSCQFCKFQTFSRIDVVRHTVQEHKDFEGGDLKFCVLLPDLLKHGLKQETAEDNTVFSPKSSFKESPDKNSRYKKDHESESDTQRLKRKRLGSSSEDESKPKKSPPRNRAIRGRKRGRPSLQRKPSKSSSASESEQPLTRRSTRSTPAEETKSNTTPGVCFECSDCKFRTFKRPVLVSHASGKHSKVKPSFSLKIVSKSQAKEIQENDEKRRSIKKSKPEMSVSQNDSANDDKKSDVSKDEKKRAGNKSSPSKDTEMKKMRSGRLHNAEVRKTGSKSDDEEVEEECMGTPVVEIDYAVEDEDDDYVASEYDDDDDEDFVPTTEKKKGHFIKRHSLNKKAEVKNDLKRPEELQKEQGTNDIEKLEARLQEQTRNNTVMSGGQGQFTCLLCSKVSKESYQTVREHYCIDHPGGSLIMSEISGDQEQWIYFCITEKCLYRNANPIPWLEHSKICVKEAFHNPDGSNIHDSVINTANTVRENTTFTQQIYRSEQVRSDVLAVKIKQEPVEDEPEQTKYIYSNEPVPIAVIPNKADVQQGTTPTFVPVHRTVTELPLHGTPPYNIPPVSAGPLSRRVNASLINKLKIDDMNKKHTTNQAETTPASNTTGLTTGVPNTAASVLPRNSGTTSASMLPSNVNTAATKLSNTGTAVAAKTDSSNQRSASTAIIKPNSSSINTVNSGQKASPSKSPQPKKSSEENEPFDVDLKGNYKCAHCRYLGSKALEIRNHMVDRHRMNPLYGLDMLAEEKQVPRFMMFCPKEGCDFCTKGKDLFLSHLNECALVEDPSKKFTDEYKKRVEVTRNFAAKTLQKLQSLTQQC